MPKKRTGRPMAGRGEDGQPVPVSTSYPQLTIRIPPAVKKLLAHLAAQEGRSQAQVIESALWAYAETAETLSPEARKSILELAAPKAKRRP